MFHFLKLVFCKQQERVEKSMPNRGKKVRFTNILAYILTTK